jgi:hypothetical protein
LRSIALIELGAITKRRNTIALLIAVVPESSAPRLVLASDVSRLINECGGEEVRRIEL